MDVLPLPAEHFTLDELRDFKKLHAILEPPGLTAPPSVRETYRAFRFLHLFGLVLVDEGRFPALGRCWEDLHDRFSHFPIFEDEMFIEAWVFIDFPIDDSDRTVLDELEVFVAQQPEARAALGPFIEAARASRLGLHQEVVSTSRTTKFRELVTGRVTSTLRSVADYEPGEIFLARIIENRGDRFLLGDPKSFPAASRTLLLDTVTRRAELMPGATPAEKYEAFMRMAGPYWLSTVSGDDDDEILPPEHMLSYHHPL